MDDAEYIRTLKKIRCLTHARYLIDITTAYITPRRILPEFANEIKSAILPEDRGIFHGYARDCGAYRAIYDQAGWRMVKEQTVGAYPHVAVLDRDVIQWSNLR